MKAKLILLLLSLFSFINLFSTNNLRIIDPQYGSWYTYPATIETAELQIKPMGAYVENNLYLTIGLSEPFTDNSRKMESSKINCPTLVILKLKWSMTLHSGSSAL